MRALFTDTSFFIALLNPKDQLHGLARETRQRLRPFLLVTTEMVLTEFLNDVCGRDERTRASASSFVEQLHEGSRTDPAVIVPQTHEQFVAACRVYAERPDKGWSLTDCASYLTMRSQDINEALTQDRHFEQMGFRALLRADA